MKVRHLHDWQVTVAQAKEVQRHLASQVSDVDGIAPVHLVAGVDVSSPRFGGESTGAVVVLSYPDMDLVEVEIARSPLNFPYIPGFLSFREAPLVLAACEKLGVSPDLILVDGQGIAHPRRLGLASHLGLLLNTPTIGCAKSRFCGVHAEVPSEPGEFVDLMDEGEVIGGVLRTKVRTNPLYISIGHMIGLKNAMDLVMACCRGYRLPEPTRLAHLAAGGHLDFDKKTSDY
ncbi:MAG: deoxyribonuclease V [Dehalococcoidia bacterium]|nr:deoxyribonuclease V [Dehalococcoidia bacterium]